ncbi:MAG: hypothetical protein IJP17_07085 [Clostridia bacterium]|nr:hypothetical protein [Clostridia bacterium]
MWNQIRCEEDINKLMAEYSQFHDSCIVSVNYKSGSEVDEQGAMRYGGLSEHTLDMVLHSQLHAPIELRFIGLRKCNIVGWQDNYFCDIFGAYLSLHTDLLEKTRDDILVVWADWDGFDPAKYIEEEIISADGRNCTYVVAEKLLWRMVQRANVH